MPETSGFDISLPASHDEGYKILRLVYESQSGFCRILEVSHAGRLFIAKSLKPEFRESKIHQSLLLREHEILSSLYHPNIIQSFGIHIIPDEGEALILEYAHGVTLQSLIESSSITEEKALSILTQICDAIDYCHQRDIIHRDLKPTNIMVHSAGPVVKLIDFNFSHSPSFTDNPLPGGTHGFSAPEQFGNTTPSLPSADIWSIGKLMTVLYPKGNRKWKNAAERCMASDPEERPSSGREILGVLTSKRLLPSKRLYIGFAAVVTSIFIGISFFHIHNNNPKTSSSQGSNSNKSNSDVSSPFSDSIPTNDSNGIALQSSAADSTGHIIYDSKGMATTEKSEMNMKEETEENTTNSSTEPPKGAIEKLYSELRAETRKVAARRHKEMLQMMDTATSFRSFQLIKVGHWRWLAKQEMNRWIASKKLSSFEEKLLKEEVEKVVKEYDKEHYEEFREAQNKAVMDRQEMLVDNVATSRRKRISSDEVLVHELGEDGVWRDRIEKSPIAN